MSNDVETPTVWNPDLVWTLIVSLGWMVPMGLFMMGHSAIDQPEPNTGGGFTGYLFAFLAATAIWALGIVYREDMPGWVFAAGGIVGAGIGALIAGIAGDSYATDGFAAGIIVVYFIGPAILIGGGLTFLTLGILRKRQGLLESCWIWGSALAGTFGVAALVHLVTIQEQAERARTAHEAPGLGFALVALGLLATALLARRHSK